MITLGEYQEFYIKQGEISMHCSDESELGHLVAELLRGDTPQWKTVTVARQSKEEYERANKIVFKLNTEKFNITSDVMKETAKRLKGQE